jgi:1,4-dihydroxy-6-naphthoate synthase
MNKISLGISPCPNDTFMFYHLIHNNQWAHNNLHLTIADVEDLNKQCIQDKLNISKVSFHLLGKLRHKYCLLKSGSALGRGCGPLLICKKKPSSLSGKTIAVPGLNTTAYLLLKCFAPDDIFIKEMLFSDIMPAVLNGEVDAGLIIHESRFTYTEFDLKLIVDLGQWWEDISQLPIPLGGIIASRSLPNDQITRFDENLKNSIQQARCTNWQKDDKMLKFILNHSQEIKPDVLKSHIDTYVSEESEELSEEGCIAIEKLFDVAEKRGFIPSCDLPLMVPPS